MHTSVTVPLVRGKGYTELSLGWDSTGPPVWVLAETCSIGAPPERWLVLLARSVSLGAITMHPRKRGHAEDGGDAVW